MQYDVMKSSLSTLVTQRLVGAQETNCQYTEMNYSMTMVCIVALGNNVSYIKRGSDCFGLSALL